MKKDTDNIELEFLFEEAVVLHEFIKRQLMKPRFSMGDKAERAALLSLFTNLESHLAGYGVLNDASWKSEVVKAKKYMTNFELQVAKAHKLAKAYKKKTSNANSTRRKS